MGIPPGFVFHDTGPGGLFVFRRRSAGGTPPGLPGSGAGRGWPSSVGRWRSRVSLATGVPMRVDSGDMTGNVRNGLGLLAAAAIAGLLGLLLPGEEVGSMALMAAIVLVFVGLWRIASGLLRPERRESD
jgi:hypothetical protein